MVSKNSLVKVKLSKSTLSKVLFPSEGGQRCTASIYSNVWSITDMLLYTNQYQTYDYLGYFILCILNRQQVYMCH